MTRRYRKSRTRARSPRVVDKSEVLGGRVRVELPVSLAEVIGGVGEEIERLTGQAGLLIMKAVMDAEVESLAGPKGRHDPNRTATRWAQQQGYVVLAGKKVNVTKPRVRDKAGHEVNLSSYQRFQSPPRREASICNHRVVRFICAASRPRPPASQSRVLGSCRTGQIRLRALGSNAIAVPRPASSRPTRNAKCTAAARLAVGPSPPGGPHARRAPPLAVLRGLRNAA